MEKNFKLFGNSVIWDIYENIEDFLDDIDGIEEDDDLISDSDFDETEDYEFDEDYDD